LILVVGIIVGCLLGATVAIRVQRGSDASRNAALLTLLCKKQGRLEDTVQSALTERAKGGGPTVTSGELARAQAKVDMVLYMHDLLCP
jgi:hypothetical protein